MRTLFIVDSFKIFFEYTLGLQDERAFSVLRSFPNGMSPLYIYPHME